MNKEEALKLGIESPSNRYVDITFTYPVTMVVKIPAEIIEQENPEVEDEEIAEWIEENIPEVSGTDPDDIRIMDIL